MVGILIDSAADDDLRRKRLYAGDVFVYKARPATLALCELARKILKAAFHPLHPRTAQHQLPVEKFAAILAEAKPAFIHDPMCKTLLPKILQDVGCDPEKTYFDVPRMRTSTCDGYLTSGIAYAFHPHRDVWYSAPMCQINWWLPVYDIEPENGMAFHPGYWSRGVENSSHTYNYAEWNKTNRHNAAQHVGRDTRVQPKANEEFDLSANFSIVTEVGGMTAFAGAQMHWSVPNATDCTRISIDFRTVHLDDVRDGRGAPNVDSACTGTTMADYLRCSDLAHIDDELIRRYDAGFARELVDS